MTIINQKKKVLFQNGSQKMEFSFPKNSHVTKIWKTAFPKEFFNKIWLKVGEHKYTYISEIKLGEKIILFRDGSQNNFNHIM